MEETLKKNNKKHIVVTLLLVLGLLSITLGVSVAFFNFMSSFILCLVLISNPNKIRELEEKN